MAKPKEAKEETLPRYLSLKEAAEFLRLTPRTLRERTQRRQIPFIQEGGKLLRFDREDLIAWMTKHKVEPIQ
jgi:excisionase family DNA binding protein